MNRQQSFLSLQSCLYVIATPIGNLEELTYRIVDTLKKVDVAFCEDTRVSLKLFQHLKIKIPLYSAYENKELEAAQQIITFLEKGQNVALLSDAGYPGISDPGPKNHSTSKRKTFSHYCIKRTLCTNSKCRSQWVFFSTFLFLWLFRCQKC